MALAYSYKAMKQASNFDNEGYRRDFEPRILSWGFGGILPGLDDLHCI